jgi:DNA mismatch repair protein MSH3
MTTPRAKSTDAKRKSSQSSLISNYFQKLDSPVQKRPLQATQPETASAQNDFPLEHSVAESESPVSSDIEEHVPKRPRLESPSTGEVGRPATPGERNALTTLMGPKIKEFRPPPVSPRTARYKYIPASPGNDVESTTPEDLQKKKSLHEKFVQKLGRPDSMATLRPPSQSEDVSQMEEEDQEEEEVPAAKSLRGKYAAPGRKNSKTPAKPAASSTTKLTPLERQYVEIKKKYPDTLLLIEVGYKFRFFGEDAKVYKLLKLTNNRLLRKN